MILFNRNDGWRTTGIMAYCEYGTNAYPEWEDDTYSQELSANTIFFS